MFWVLSCTFCNRCAWSETTYSSLISSCNFCRHRSPWISPHVCHEDIKNFAVLEKKKYISKYLQKQDYMHVMYDKIISLLSIQSYIITHISWHVSCKNFGVLWVLLGVFSHSKPHLEERKGDAFSGQGLFSAPLQLKYIKVRYLSYNQEKEFCLRKLLQLDMQSFSERECKENCMKIFPTRWNVL